MKTNLRSVAQRARRDAESELREPAPQLPPHGTEAAHLTGHWLGRPVDLIALHTGHHSRSYGLWINGLHIGVVGKVRALRELSKALPSPMSIRHCR